MIPRPRFGRNCLTRDPSGVLARDARCRLLVFRSAGDHWQVDLQITPNRRSWLLLTNRKWQFAGLQSGFYLPPAAISILRSREKGLARGVSRVLEPDLPENPPAAERTELMPSRLFPSARHNCSREVDGRRWTAGGGRQEVDGRKGQQGWTGVQIRLRQPLFILRRRRGLRRRCARPGRRPCAVPCGIPRGSRPR